MSFSAHQNLPELAQLRDIHMPLPISWWPLAPGYYLLAFISIFLIISIIFWGVRRHKYGLPCRQALKALLLCEEQHKLDPNRQRSCAMVSELLKRTALAYYPRAQVAGLQGEAWLDFLNNKLSSIDLIRDALLEYPYQPSQESDLTLLFKISREWVNVHRRLKPIVMRYKCSS